MRQKNDKVVLAPTDLSNFLSCRHLSRLDLDAALGARVRPVRYGPLIDELQERGLTHERNFLEFLRTQGLSVAVAVAEAEQSGPAKTLAVMRQGYDVIYQPMLADERWSGRADFLRKVAMPSALGEWSYEAIDTKLARETKAGTILQLCVYSHLLEHLQGVRPKFMHVVTPGDRFEQIQYRVDDYAAYYRLLEFGVERFLLAPGATYPDLVSHCDFCAWWSQCEQRRRGDDHLCYVAGISTSQIKTLRAHGVNALGALAALEALPDPKQGSKEALARVRDQARVQQQSRELKAPYYEFKTPFDAEHGLAALPAPNEDDVFLDFEGNHFAEHGVQEYLTGFITRDRHGKQAYSALWATDLAAEQAAYEEFIDPTPRSGKIMRRLLRDIADGKALGDTTTLADPNVVARLKGEYEAIES